MAVYKIADVCFSLKTVYGYTPKMCEEYLTNEQPEFEIITTKEDIEREKVTDEEFPDWYLESLAVYRKLCTEITEKYDGFIFHASALEVDGNAYIFTAPSGTGKSTHSRLWRELLGDKVIMVNDDKPIFRRINGEFFVYGTPWNGKHHLSTNKKAKIKAVAEIYQSKENVIKRVSSKELFATLFNQTLRFDNKNNMIKLLDLLDDFMAKTNFYKLGVNMDISAADMAYNVMSKDIDKE